MVGEAKKYGVKLILTLVNNYNDYGGKPQYVQWAKNAGASVNNEDDFYTNSVTKDYYKNHVKVCYLKHRFWENLYIIVLLRS